MEKNTVKSAYLTAIIFGALGSATYADSGVPSTPQNGTDNNNPAVLQQYNYEVPSNLVDPNTNDTTIQNNPNPNMEKPPAAEGLVQPGAIETPVYESSSP